MQGRDAFTADLRLKGFIDDSYCGYDRSTEL